ncbi:MAG: sensor signal transduction histidine kinase [Candidatus Saccharibacteria bacterium]|nr:sensor signal transduction histidine kinase [Candidatus Saccharibacteria bacterium]
MWSNLGIRQKVFILFSVIALLPLIVINVVWLRTSHSQLRDSAVNRQNIYIEGASERVNNLIESKINSLIARSQEQGIIDLNSDESSISLQQYANQDSDILRVSLTDNAGNEKVVVNNHELSSAHSNVKDTKPFSVVTLLSNDVLLGDIEYDNNVPTLTASVPLFTNSKLGAQNLTDQEALARRYGSDIKGALIVKYSLRSIWDSIITSEVGGKSYAYIVDSKGKILAHPDLSFMKSKPDVSKAGQVVSFLAKPTQKNQPAVTTSEKNVEVLSANYFIKRTGWGVIIEEPTTSIFAPANYILRLSITIFCIAALASILLSLLFSRNITGPISRLVAGTSKASEGDLGTQITIESSDEIGLLARRFNLMTYNLDRMVKNMQNESAKLTVVLNSVNECIIATDTLNNIVFANISAAVLVGMLPAQLTGKRFDELFKLMDGNKPFVVNPDSTTVAKDIIFVSPNERIHFLDIVINKIEHDRDGIRNIITLRDQTNERELEAMKLDFVSMAAHELRTPLTAVRGYLSLLLGDTSSNLSAESRQSVERAQSNTKQLVGLINNLLNVSKIERGSLNISYTSLDWSKVVQQVLDDHKFSAQEKRITISYEGPIEGVMLLADELAIREVLDNLVSNAIHYTDVDGHVVVGVRSENDKVITYVRDDGIGMTANVLTHLFTKFFRAKGPLASGSGGTGLGLFISKSIVELHQGKIWVESESGKGSTFTFSLPKNNTVQYNKAESDNENTGVKKSRGWITKNITR